MGLSLLSDETKLGFKDFKQTTKLIQNDTFDRVINIKFYYTENIIENGTSKVKEDSFVIRSDFELVSAETIQNAVNNSTALPKNYFIRKCKQKPSIQVSYKSVTDNTGIKIDVYIDNFFILAPDNMTKLEMTSENFRIKAFELQLGYFGQFQSCYPTGFPTSNKEFNELPSGNCIQTLTCSVSYVQNEGVPPAYTTHIHGYVSSNKRETFNKDFDIPDDEVKDREAEDGDTLDYAKMSATYDSGGCACVSIVDMMYNLVTRRFTRKPMQLLSSQGLKALSADKSKNIMSKANADKYGVHIFYSDGAIKEKSTKIRAGKEIIYDADGSPLPTGKSGKVMFNYFGTTVESTIYGILNHLGYGLCVVWLTSGDVLLITPKELNDYTGEVWKDIKFWTATQNTSSNNTDYKGEEDIDPKKLGLMEYSYEEFANSTFSQLVQEQDLKKSQVAVNNSGGKAKVVKQMKIKYKSPEGENILPAINSAQYGGGLSYIVCPFYYFVDIFSTIKFVSRYMEQSLVTYYGSSNNVFEKFQVLWATVKFATVDDINEMQLTVNKWLD